MSSLYGIIADVRRERPSPATTKTLDILISELGRARDNIRDALANLDGRELPPGGREVVEEVLARAERAGVDDLQYPPPPGERVVYEPLDEGTAGIGALLAISSLIVFALAVIAIVAGLNQHLHFLHF
jgi:hypothetical protein